MAKTTLHLKAPPGTDEANFGQTRYRVNNDGTVEVPAEAAPALLDKGGFVANDDTPAPVLPANHVHVRHVSDPTARAGWGGLEFVPDKHGLLHVPVEALEGLLAHGFILVEG